MFGRALFLVIVAGALIGWLMPGDARQDAVPAAARTAQPGFAVPPPTPLPRAMPASPPPASHAGREIVIDRKPDGHFYADAMVNGQLVRFLVDTGATAVALTAKDARHVGLPFSPAEFTVVGRGASGDVRGKPVTIDRIAIGHVEATGVRGAIIDDGLDVSLLGQSFLSRVGSVRIADNRMTLR